jgi:hypothetical protein
MLETRFSSWLAAVASVAALIWISLASPAAHAQCGDPPDPWSTWSQYVAICHKYGGHIANQHCVGWDTNWCHRNGASAEPTEPSPAEIEAERKREAEKERLEELQRQMEQERQRREAEQKRAQEEFLRQVNEAARRLKGVSHDELGLKGVGDQTAFFGLKGVSPNEATTMIKTAPPDASSRDVSTAKKQLTCAADITNYALKHVSNIVAGTGTGADMDEINYLAGEAANALQGNPLGVQCNSSATLKFVKAPDLPKITPAYKTALDNMVRDSKRLYDTQQQAVAAQQKVEEAKKRLVDLKNQPATQSSQQQASPQTSTKPPPSSGDPSVDKAYAEQKAWQLKDQERINQIYAEQKKGQQQQFDALAVLRKARAEQAELNAINSQKVSATKALTQDAKDLKQLQSGNVPQQ